jgi:hypothetical protein
MELGTALIRMERRHGGNVCYSARQLNVAQKKKSQGYRMLLAG